ncbi:hypothetical protein HNO88_000674 [Novosphingobium chloroacetimidivorans]|uniref:Uncharacterized protein n=1 Tax=Novosphingobium chloroacetimidivorans TaxID=1428314 RepID=A0A7W7K6Z5_9SPHN|nr:hypothetical protein [Novosphingobium chloroacetimidivorans]MBB4857367.1 hypothetical protein [Novosphingobium chloroacetimidivorans]
MLASTGARAEIATTRFADMAMITHWSLPGRTEPPGPLPEPIFVAPSPIASGHAVPMPASPLQGSTRATATTAASAQPVLGPKLAAEDLEARGFARSDRLLPARTPVDIKRLEIAFHLLNAADAISTVTCLQRDDCQEENPIYGKRPKPAVIIGAKALTSGVHYWVMRTLLPDHPGMARVFGWFSVTVQGTVVGLNMRQLL